VVEVLTNVEDQRLAEQPHFVFEHFALLADALGGLLLRLGVFVCHHVGDALGEEAEVVLQHVALLRPADQTKAFNDQRADLLGGLLEGL